MRALAVYGKVDLIQELFDYMKLKSLDIPLSINLWNKNDDNALGLTAKHNRAEAFVLLVKQGGNVHLRDTKLNTVFNIILDNESEAVLKAFFEHFPKLSLF